MTRRGPVEYVFNLKHYLVCISVFLFGLCSSLSILTSFIISVVKEDLAIPLLILYELSIFSVKFIENKNLEKTDA